MLIEWGPWLGQQLVVGALAGGIGRQAPGGPERQAIWGPIFWIARAALTGCATEQMQESIDDLIFDFAGAVTY